MAAVKAAAVSVDMAPSSAASKPPFNPSVGDPEPVPFGVSLRPAARQSPHHGQVTPVVGGESEAGVEQGELGPAAAGLRDSARARQYADPEAEPQAGRRDRLLTQLGHERIDPVPLGGDL